MEDFLEETPNETREESLNTLDFLQSIELAPIDLKVDFLIQNESSF